MFLFIYYLFNFYLVFVAASKINSSLLFFFSLFYGMLGCAMYFFSFACVMKEQNCQGKQGKHCKQKKEEKLSIFLTVAR